MESSTIIHDPEAAAVAAPEPPAPLPQWPASMAFLTAWLMPARTARRTEYVSLRQAYGVHLIAFALTPIVIMAFAAWADRPRLFFQAFGNMFSELFEEWDRHSQEIVLAFLGTFVAVEIGFLLLAWLLTPWGARVEPMRQSFRHALRRVWLQTPHALMAVILVGLFLVPLEGARARWFEEHSSSFLSYSPPPYNPPSPPSGVKMTSKAWQDHLAAVQQYNTQYAQANQQYIQTLQAQQQAYRDQQPAWVRYFKLYILGSSLLAISWVVWALLRAVGAERTTPQLPHPPSCETCGYNLTKAPMEGLCSECGEPVRDSLGPGVRPGTVWQCSANGPVADYFQSCGAAVVLPKKFGRQIRLLSPGTDHRALVAFHWIAVFIVSCGGFVLSVVTAAGPQVLQQDRQLFFVMPVVGYMTAMATLGFTLLAAGVVGSWQSAREKRNLLPVTVQIASYLGAFLTVGVAFAWCSGAVVLGMELAFREWARPLSIYGETLQFSVWIPLNLIWLVAYFWMLWTATSGARYANR